MIRLSDCNSIFIVATTLNSKSLPRRVNRYYKFLRRILGLILIFSKMNLIQQLRQLHQFIIVIVSGLSKFLIYKLFNRSNIQRNEEDICGKCVVITGGSTGIGKSSAKEFARRGATVVIGDIDLENGQKAVKEIQAETGNMNVVNAFLIFFSGN